MLVFLKGGTVMKKAIGYLRVSTAEQGKDDHYGLEAQKDAITKYALANGYVIVEWAKDVISGVKENRPAFDEIVFGADVKNPPYEAVIVYKSDRVARDIKLFFYFLFMLGKKNVSLISATENFNDADPTVHAQMALMIFCAEQERRNIEMRTRAGRAVKSARGGYSGGRPPFGYKTVRGVLTVDDVEAPVVRMIFEMRDTHGLSLDAIAEYLTDQQIANKSGVVAWSRQRIHQIVRNRKFYEGYYKYGDMTEWVKGEHEAIL